VTTPPSSYHPNNIGSSDQRRPARTFASTVSATVCSAGLLVSKASVRSAYSSNSEVSVHGTHEACHVIYIP
jgi:hypothetical protein